MNRIDEMFRCAKNDNRACLIGYITAGDPDLERSFEIIDAACEAGLDALELGIPFFDPIADGPVIQRAVSRAIQAGTTLEDGIALVNRLRKRFDLPIIVFSYNTPILAMGTERFVNDSIEAGADGALIVDMPNENVDDVLRHVNSSKPFSLIRLITPTTDPEMRREIVSKATGFVYVVSRRGVTGAGKIDWGPLSAKMSILRKETTTPLCIGFGITTPNDVRIASKIADGVIVGSAIQRIIEEHPNTAAKIVSDYIKKLRLSL